jgi:hypothetical protein
MARQLILLWKFLAAKPVQSSQTHFVTKELLVVAAGLQLWEVKIMDIVNVQFVLWILA